MFAIAEALRTGKGSVHDSAGQLTVVLPVKNDDKCRRCHDEEGPVRAVVAIQYISPEASARTPFA